jgi:hypothetical protein
MAITNTIKGCKYKIPGEIPKVFREKSVEIFKNYLPDY